MSKKGYDLPFIPLSKLRDLKISAETEFFEFKFDEKDLWYLLIRLEIDRILIEELETKIRNARNYQGVEGYACPLCEYREGVWIKNCSMHQQIDDLKEELEKTRAIIESYEND